MSKLAPDVEKEIKKATKLYKEFHWGYKFNKQFKVDLEIPEVVFALGFVRSITYQTRKKGDKKDMFYIHAFNPPFPTLTCNNEGNQLFILGGGYRITDRGIIN